MAEAHQPGIAQQQIEGAGEEREAQRRHQEDRIGEERRDQPERQQHEADVALIDDGAGHLLCPNRPAGLTSRTIAMTTKITVLEAGG